MARNRKREGNRLWMVALIKWLLACAVIVTIGFGYIWQKNANYKLGDDIKQREQQLETLRKQNVVLRDKIANLTAPRVLEHKCAIWRLDLGMPKEAQIVRLTDPMLPPRPAGAGQLAAGDREVRDN